MGEKFPVDTIDAKCQTNKRIDEASSTVSYVGYAEPGTATSSAQWQIRRVTISGTQTITEFADGDTQFNNVWDNRAALSYS